MAPSTPTARSILANVIVTPVIFSQRYLKNTVYLNIAYGKNKTLSSQRFIIGWLCPVYGGAGNYYQRNYVCSLTKSISVILVANMATSQYSRSRGFTILEVLLVLSVAGLIIIIVFATVPALQRNSRNSQRKRDLGRYYAALEEYKLDKHNTNAPFPTMSPQDQTDFNEFKNSYLPQDIVAKYDLSQIDADSQGHDMYVDPNRIVYFAYHFCNDGTEAANNEVAGAHKFFNYSILIGLEPSTTHCLDNGKDPS